MENLVGKDILNYRIEQELGKGGMGSVYLAVNKNINQKVAIKVLNANLADSVVIRKRFRDEAQLLCSLDHPNIVKFLNFVENDDGVFLIMELIDGITLEEFINGKNGLIVEKRAYEMFDQILNAFAYAHKKGVVHRDIKPANIILTGDADGNFVPKVLDFGIATIVSESTETEKGWVVGTPAYMSPEQVLGVKVDNRSDIYSLGVLLHQMLTGRAPYDTTTLSELEINNKVVKDPLPRMKEFYPYISDKMQKIVDMATVKDPSKRFQNCNDFRKILKNTLNPDPVKRGIKIASAALVLLLLGGGLFLGDYYRKKTYYYKDYVEQWGVPVGIHKLSGAEFSHRQSSYRFEYKQRKLRTLALVNSKGNIVTSDLEAERFDRPLNAAFNYRANGNIDYVLYFDRNGKALLKKSYDEGKDGKINQVIFRYNDEYGTEKKLPKDMTGHVKLENEYAERGLISRFAVIFDDRGFIQTMHYRNENQPVGDGEHIYGKRYERDDKGRVIKEYLLGRDDNTRATSWGLGIKQFEYDAEDNWIKAVYLAPDGSPSYQTKDGVSVLAMEYDQKYGNLIYKWFQNFEGNLTMPKTMGVAGIKHEHNNEGQETEMFYLGTDKNPMYSPSAGYTGVQFEWDENGYLVKGTYIDENGQPSVNNKGTAFVVSKNDSKGNFLETQFFDINNQPYETPDGPSKIVWEYDHMGNQLSQFFYDTNDSLSLSKAGIAGWSAEYNDQNKQTKIVNYGTDKQPGENNAGVMVAKYDYDVRGNNIKTSYFDADEVTLKLNNEGIAGWKREYDNGKVKTEENFDENEQTTEGYLGYAKEQFTYDDMGHVVDMADFDKNGSLINGYRYAFDERGNHIETYKYGKDNKLVKGYAIQRSRYDEHDNLIEEGWYNANNQLDTDGQYAKITYAFDDRNQETEKRYYNANGNLTVVESEGYAIQKIEYDNRGNEIKVSYFNAAETPLRRVKKGSYAYAIRIAEYDDLGKITRALFLDEKGNPSKENEKIEDGAPAELIYGHDKWGNTNYKATADGSGKIIDSPFAGFAITRTEYDIRGNVISDSFFDKDDKPCITKADGVHKMLWVFDKYNRKIEASYYDVNNKPSIRKSENTAKTEFLYDKNGNIIEIRDYDESLSLRKNTYAIEKNKYDEQNRLIERAWYNYLERPMNNSTLGHRFVRQYGKSGVIYASYYDINNTLVLELIYNPNTSQWERVDNWRAYFGLEKMYLPIELTDYSKIVNMFVSGNNCTITIQISYSKYDLSNEDLKILENDGKVVLEHYRKNAKMPENAVLFVLGVDNEGRDLFRVSQ